jgi:surface carbohydrate biosynthesis protein
MKIALPIETKVREFRGKLWLALNLVAKDHEVTIGNMASMNKGVDVIEPDIYFGDSAYYRPTREKLYRRIQNEGGKVVVLDTEGGVFKSDKEYEKRLSPQILKYIDHFCAWGSRPAEIAAQTEQLSEKKIHITGNPRFDLLHSDLKGIYRPAAEGYQDRYGKYILINTNFTIANPFDEDILETTDTEKIQYQNELYRRFIEAIQYLSENLREYVLIVRPHPSEDHDRYRNEFQSYNSIKVRHDGDVRSWIYGATATLHNSCTTGIESALMGIPVLSYRPIRNHDYDLELPNIVSKEVSNHADIPSLITNLNDNAEFKLNNKQISTLKQYFYNIEERAALRIVSVIENDSNLTSSSMDFVGGPPPKQLIKRMSNYLFGVHTTEEILQSLSYQDYSYMRQKFSGLSAEEIQREIQNICIFTEVPEISITHRRSLGDVFTLSKKRAN